MTLDTLEVLFGLGLVEQLVTIVAWFCLFTFVYGLVSVYNKFS